MMFMHNKRQRQQTQGLQRKNYIESRNAMEKNKRYTENSYNDTKSNYTINTLNKKQNTNK